MSHRLSDDQFIGQLRTATQVSGLVLAETDYAPGLVVPAHAHDHGLCSLVLDGSFTERRGAQSAECAAGGLIFHPGHEPHGHDFGSGGGRCFTVVFGAQWMARVEPLGILHPRSPADMHQSAAGWLASRLYAEFRTAGPSALTVEGLALALLGELTRQPESVERPGGRPAWLRRAVERLEASFMENVSLVSVAADCQVDPRHLARTFRQHVGCTMSEYVRRLRVAFVERELCAGHRALSDIALSAGFADQAHMSRVFRQATGQTPGAFRRSATGR
jgi:AraC family transcriptional regulator